jgi:DNA-nicking Smr family endonuclease
VTETVEPLGQRDHAGPSDMADKPTSAAAPVDKPPARPRTGTAALAPIDRRTMNRLGRGAIAIDASIDLHGMTLAMAHGRLVRFLRDAQSHGARLAMVITGKGGRLSGKDPDDGATRGVLRRETRIWLASPELRPFVVGFGEAAPVHGGAGALYVRLRRPRGALR